MKTKRFHLRAVLSVTTLRLLTARKSEQDNGIGDMVDLLDWMTNDSNFTHQLPRAAKECSPWLLRWFPDLAKADDALPKLDIMREAGKEQGCDLWIGAMIDLGLPEWYDVPQLPTGVHEEKNPLSELVEMRGTDEGVVVVDLGG